jgi:PBP1b-binding outer membrane lipoprotein LpoB
MKKILIAIVGVMFISGCSLYAPIFHQTNVPTQAQLDQIAKADTFTGQISRESFVKSWDFFHLNLKIWVVSDNGGEDIFFIRDNSIIVDASGKYINMEEVKDLLVKKVEIKYFIITDATGGSSSGSSGFSEEIGKNGVLLMHFLY